MGELMNSFICKALGTKKLFFRHLTFYPNKLMIESFFRDKMYLLQKFLIDSRNMYVVERYFHGKVITFKEMVLL